MKQTILMIVALAGAVAVAGALQVNRTIEQKHLMIATPEGPNIGLAANNLERRETDWNVVQLNGNVEIRTKDMILRADEAIYNQKTGEIDTRGTVHIKLGSQR